LKDEELNWYKI